jgi:hypothetical protein
MVGGQKINDKQNGKQMSPLTITIWLHFVLFLQPNITSHGWPGPSKQFLPLSFKTQSAETFYKQKIVP